MGSDDETGRRLAPRTAYPSSLARAALRRHTPKVGAGCPNRARPDLCGGCSVMGIPTAILGHEHRFRPPSLNGGCRFSQRTFAGPWATRKMRRLCSPCAACSAGLAPSCASCRATRPISIRSNKFLRQAQDPTAQVDRAGIEVDFIPTQHDEFLDAYARQQRNYHQPHLFICHGGHKRVTSASVSSRSP